MNSSPLADKLIVITGAAGFIGSCMARFLNDQGMRRLVLVDDVGRSDRWKNLLGKQFIAFLSRHELFEWLKDRHSEIGAFIHLGACSDTTETDGNLLMQINFGYTVRLAEYALVHRIRFIYASSAATYGAGELGFSDDESLLERLTPLNLYGFSKSYFDSWAKQNGVLDQVVGLKYFNVFGPNENHKGAMASMVSKMVPLVQAEGVIRLFKSTDPEQFPDGDQCRDFIYVKDAVRLSAAFLHNTVGGIFNIGAGEVATWNQLARAVFNALNMPPRIEYIDMPAALKQQYQNYTRADMQKYRRCMQTETVCTFSLQEAVDDYVKNYLVPGKRW